MSAGPSAGVPSAGVMACRRSNAFRCRAGQCAAPFRGMAPHEQSLYETLAEVWRQPERRLRLRLVAMLCFGAMHVAIETWRAEQGARRRT